MQTAASGPGSVECPVYPPDSAFMGGVKTPVVCMEQLCQLPIPGASKELTWDSVLKTRAAKGSLFLSLTRKDGSSQEAMTLEGTQSLACLGLIRHRPEETRWGMEHETSLQPYFVLKILC